MVSISFKTLPVPASNWETVPVFIRQSFRFALTCCCCCCCCCRAIRWAMSASGPGSSSTRTPSRCPGGFCLEECTSRSPTTATHPPSTRPWLASHTVSFHFFTDQTSQRDKLQLQGASCQLKMLQTPYFWTEFSAVELIFLFLISQLHVLPLSFSFWRLQML